jgi:hypothetical protein
MARQRAGVSAGSGPGKHDGLAASGVQGRNRDEEAFRVATAFTAFAVCAAVFTSAAATAAPAATTR